MKKTIIISALFATIICSSCTKDLDQRPVTDSQADAGEVYSNADGYRSVLAKIYASFVICGQEKGGGNSDLSSNNGHDFLRGYFNLQEGPTEEMAGTWLSGDKIEGLTYMSWDANDPWVADTYYRAYYTIALANEFLSHTENLDSFSDTDKSAIKAYAAEARFLRALAYYYVLDLFGKGPFVDETMGIGSYVPECYSNKQLFDYIKGELDTITADGLLDSPENGRASKYAAYALLARLCLNAEVYDAGAHYSDCIEYCDKIVKAGYTLENDYAKLFSADNHKRTNEIIFAFVVDSQNTVSWGATTYIVCGECGNSNEQNPADYGLTGGWGMFRVRGELPALFESGDGRSMFWTNGGAQPQYFTKGIDDQSEGYFGEKFSNLKDDGTYGDTGADGADIDYPLFRLADVYLMIAESVLRGGSYGEYTSADAALPCVNNVRERAYGNTSGNINVAQLNLQFILDERGRELYWESVRRTDLIRFGKFTGGDYLWQWKGGVLDGRATDSKYNVYPIPAAELSANPNLKNENY